MTGAIKINSEEIEQIKWINQRLRFDHKLLWVQLGGRDYMGASWGCQTKRFQFRRCGERLKERKFTQTRFILSVPH
jgi:hypothetical protein